MDAVYRFIIMIGFSVLSTHHALAEESVKTKNFSHAIPKLACPAKDFSTFFAKFSDDENIQRAYTELPFREQFTDIESNPLEPPVTKKKLGYMEIKFPIIPLAAEREKELLITQVHSVQGNKAVARLYKDDTCYMNYYYFTYKQGCWRLIKAEY